VRRRLPLSSLRPAILGALVTLAIVTVLPAGKALAASNQDAMFQDFAQLLANPSRTLHTLRLLGVDRLRLAMEWYQLAPQANSHRRPKHFNEGNPASYPPRNWAIWDEIMKDAGQDGIQVDLDLYGLAPLWATGPGVPNDHQQHHNWDPSANDFKQFVHAVGERYSGNFDPVTNSVSPGNPDDLPRVGFWSIWNEPNLGFMLAPQGVLGNLQIENSGRMYRVLLNAAWTSLQQTGHGRDTILIGELAPRGTTRFGVFAAMKPLIFLRALYCVDSSYRQLRGAAAAVRGCPTTAAGSRRFRAANPALFSASAFGQHLWMRWYPPNKDPEDDPDYTSLPQVGGLERALDRLQRTYGSRKRFQIYDTEFGYVTSPPNRPPFPSPTTAAMYLNWAEYISWRAPRVESFAQYLLRDPVPTKTDFGGWATGLLTTRGVEKPAYSAWRLPLYLPVTSASRRRNLELWGCLRPARFAILDTGQPQTAQIQFKRGTRAPWTTLRTVTISTASNCYFDVHLRFSGSGTVRLSYTYPANDPRLTPNDGTIYSRSVRVALH
jgi:hypothetical protein